MFEFFKSVFGKKSMKEQAADAFIGTLLEQLNENRGVHIETAITASAAMIGTSMIRNSGIELKDIKPGETVLIESLNEEGIRLLNLLANFCRQNGIDPKTGWTDEIPADNQPHRPFLQLAQDVERSFRLSCEMLDIPQSQLPEVAVIATGKLIKQGSTVLSPEIGKALAGWTLIASSKTAPHPYAKS
jgi:hypothetical protein